jgi:hypothetical protein
MELAASAAGKVYRGGVAVVIGGLSFSIMPPLALAPICHLSVRGPED